MAIQSTIYTNDGVTRTFPSTKHISTIQHVGVYRKRVLDNVWVIVNISDYNLVQNSIIFDIAPDIALYSQVEIRVADDATEITTAPSDIATVAGSIASVNTDATNIASIITVATNIGSVNNTSANIANVNAVGGSILNVNAVASDLANVNAVALDLTNIDINATNIASINTNAGNIVAIQNASANATLAQKWASELEDVIVASGLYSAHHWAIKAAASAASLVVDATPTDGSTNAVSSNGVFDALASKANKTGDFFTGGISISTSNLITNGTFDTNTSGWTDTSSIVSSFSANKLRTSNTAPGGLRGTYQAIQTVVGKKYTIEVNYEFISGDGADYPAISKSDTTGFSGTNAVMLYPLSRTAGTNRATLEFTATATTSYIFVGSYSLNTTPTIVDYDNIIVKEIALQVNGDISMAGAITALRETKVAMGANDINLATGNLFTKTISGATTLTVSNWLATGNANSFILELTNGGSAAVTWFAGVKWASGTAPTLTAAGVDILGFYSHDGGTTVRGIVLAKDSR